MKNKRTNNVIITLSLSFAFFLLFTFCNNIYAPQPQQPQQQTVQEQQSLSGENITIYDPNLKLELVTSGLDFPTTMAFLDDDDVFIVELLVSEEGSGFDIFSSLITLVVCPLANSNVVKYCRGDTSKIIPNKNNLFLV